MNQRKPPQDGPPDTREQDRTRREYSHGSGDRNTEPDHHGRGEFRGGEQRRAGTDDRPADTGGH